MIDFSPSDLRLHRKVTELHTVHGATMAVGTVRSVDSANDGYNSAIWTFPFDGSPPRQFTTGTALDQHPRLAPGQDRIAFLSDRAQGPTQIYTARCDGGEARQTGSFDGGASSAAWMPDGRALLCQAVVSVDPDGRGASAQADDSPAKKNAPEVCWRLPYKSDGAGYLLGRQIHLFHVDADSGEQQQLTQGAFDVLAAAPAPDGRAVAYVRTRDGRFAHCTDLWRCDARGEQHQRLTHDHALVMSPAWSLDGQFIAFGGSQTEGDGECRLWLLECATGNVRPFGPPDLECADAESMQWSADSRQLTLVRAHRGRHEVVAIALADDALTVLVAGDRQFGAFATNGDTLAYSPDAPHLASEVVMRPATEGEERTVSRFNPWWAERPAIDVRARQFEVPDGAGGTETIEGWLLRAAGSSGPQPLLNDVHGGPASYALLDFDSNVYWQALCAQGWSVLLLNPVGSSSFGHDFCARLAGRWGELDLPQHQAAIRALQAEGVCDERIAIAGKSYGGYFTGWAIGHSDAFRAAVVMAPVGNIETHYGTSDGGYYADPLYIGTAPGFDRARARAISPLQHVEKATTPTLFLQGKDDERTPKCQSEELFVSLYRAGDTPTELVMYPGEGHSFLGQGQPSTREDAAERVVRWLTQHIDAAPQPLALQTKAGAQ